MVGGFVADEIAPHAAQIDREGVPLEDGEAVFPPRLAGIFEQIKAARAARALPAARARRPERAAARSTSSPREMIGARRRLGDGAPRLPRRHGDGDAALLASTRARPRSTATRARSSRRASPTYIDEIVARRRLGLHGHHRARRRQRHGARCAPAASRTTTATGSSPGRRSSSPRATASTTSSSRAPRTAKDAPTIRSPASRASRCSWCRPTRTCPTARASASSPSERVEEKLGHHGSVTAALAFDRAPAELIGKRGEGFKYMLVLMNNARVGVGFECIGLLEAAYRLARGLRRRAPSMGKTIARHEMIADYLDEMRTDVQALRALAVHGAFHEEMAQKKLAGASRSPPSPTREEAARARDRRATARRRAASRRCSSTSPPRRRSRSRAAACRSTAASATRGLRRREAAARRDGDADLRGHQPDPVADGDEGHARRHPQESAALRARAARRRAGARSRRAIRWSARVARIQTLSLSAQQHLILRTAGDKLKALARAADRRVAAAFLRNWDPKRDFACAMLHAERLTRLLADEAVAELLLEQAKAHPERRELLERWLERAEPRCRHLLDEITSTGDRLLGKLRGEASGSRRRRSHERSTQVHSLSGAGVARDGRSRRRRAQAAAGQERQDARGAPTLPGPEHRITVSPRAAPSW